MQISILSGLAQKTPACILADTGKTQILLDLGEGPAKGIFPDLPELPRLAAILITHDHMDHVDGLKKFHLKVPVYVTAGAAHAVPESYQKVIIPDCGRFQIGDIPVTTGRTGHSLGSVWFHLGVGKGFFYSGDLCLESDLFPFDSPPKADLAALDTSYGCLNTNRDGIVNELIARACTGQCLLPVPPSGRALEIAITLKEFGFDSFSMDRDCWQAWERMCRLNRKDKQVTDRLEYLGTHDRNFDPEALILLANSPCGSYGKARQIIDTWLPQGLGSRQIIYTGYLTRECRYQVETGTASRLLWNVHPRAGDIRTLITRTGCRNWIPMFSEQGVDRDWTSAFPLLPTLEKEWTL